jgi:IclR family pca regulon transcriptional regulator
MKMAKREESREPFGGSPARAAKGSAGNGGQSRGAAAKARSAKHSAGKRRANTHGVPSDGGRYSQSLSHGLAILASFDAKHPTLGIADMAEMLSMSRSTTHRYATTLAELGYLEQNSSRRYRLTPRAADLGLSALSAMTLREPARRVLRVLRERTGRSVSLGVLSASEVLLVDRLRGWRGLHELDLSLGPASRLPLHCTAIGKVLLAYLPEPQQRELLATLALSRRGPNSITVKRALREELERVRDLGFAIEDEELAAGLRSIAVPVLDEAGLAEAAIGLAASAKTVARADLQAEFGAALDEAAEALAVAV